MTALLPVQQVEVVEESQSDLATIMKSNFLPSRL